MAFVDPVTIHNPTSGSAPPNTWGDQLRDNDVYLYERGPYICTSSTRPGAPAEGCVIYETNTDKYYSWSGAAWVQMLATGAWTAYTSTVTGWTLGNGVASGTYQKVGRMVTCRGICQTGSTTVFTSNVVLSLPFQAGTGDQWSYGGILSDVSSGIQTPCWWRITASGTTVTPYAMSAVNQVNNAGLTSAVPFSWQQPDDYLGWSFTYEAVS